jgi:hypothetical protein
MNESIATSVPVVPAAPAASASGVRFTGIRRDFGDLIVRGALLELITLGFYRFWLATDMRRHLWSHTEVGGDTAEYTGTAKELLIGFLFALAILVPIYLAYFFVTLEAERWYAFASVPLLLFFYLFTQFAVYRARRYRLTRTIWRGVRLWMTGSGWAYAFRAFGWSILTGVTLGLALPWMRASLERYKMRHTFYGDLPGDFVATGGEFFKRGWWLWLLMWLTGWLVIPLPFLYSMYKAVEWRWWISGLTVGPVSAYCKLDIAALMDLYWKVIGWAALLMIILGAFTGVLAKAMAMFLQGLSGTVGQTGAALMQHPVLLGIFVVSYLVWARVVDTTVVHNLEAADNVTGRGELASSLGEGLADSLDVGGI